MVLIPAVIAGISCFIEFISRLLHLNLTIFNHKSLNLRPVKKLF